MAKRFVYFYFMKSSPAIREVVPRHVDYWKQLHPDGYSGGPFADRSGGLITFEAVSLDEARSFVEADPFVERDLLESMWVKEWIPE